jgi:hypothetical protein
MHLGVSLSGVEGHFQQIGLHFELPNSRRSGAQTDSISPFVTASLSKISLF